MSNASLVSLLILGLAYAIYAIPTMLQFYSYCEQVAEATGKINENNKLWGTDDGGNNGFQREVLRKLSAGEFTHYEDHALVDQGRVLAHKLQLLRWSAIGLVLSVVVIELWSR
ncbi:hypothetical protein [Undibacterium terreum]|uniref:Uncharacterized protein n=1 Tax=Undibacterium terreum TaxID=1224302 RepID=A0A916XCZ0_9BURK|nr:hypothetical protein [Undibacterium terreum]GGC64772.1 hypothetical protein GCM10011396_09730 [Undibacterium terreum]